MTTYKFGFNAFWWEQLHTEDAVRDCAQSIKEIGYEAVEFKRFSFKPQKSLADDFSMAARVCQEEGLTVSNFVVLRNLVDTEHRDEGISDIIECIEATAASGVPILNFTTGNTQTVRKYDDWWMPSQVDVSSAWNCLYDSVERILKAAEKNGVYLALEACVGTFIHDFYTAEHLLNKFDSAHLGATFDPSHFALARQDIPWIINQWKDKIYHVHLKDAVGDPKGSFLFPLIGEGMIDWKAFFHAMDSINYDGTMSIEFESFKFMYHVLQDPAKAAELSMMALKKLLLL